MGENEHIVQFRGGWYLPDALERVLRHALRRQAAGSWEVVERDARGVGRLTDFALIKVWYRSLSASFELENKYAYVITLTLTLYYHS